ncbi:MAG: ABC transporter substrate-binding protein [Rhodospirillaceae bacterium]|nr:ABC transporter substrate-binding protein [Rhodospirillaceae bacterium]
MFSRRNLFAVLGTFALAAAGHGAQAMVLGRPVHALTLYGEPKHGPDFKNFDYVNPNAPRGGTLVITNQNDKTFDTFNGFTLKGAPVNSSGLMYDVLMTSGLDEPFTMYCQVCETVEVAPDNTWVQFKIRSIARFQDGSPVTAEDVAFSYTTLVEKGAPQYRLYWADVAKVEVKDAATVRFTFKTATNRELPAIIGQILPILSKAYWSKRDFTATTLDVPLASGPYTIESYDIGRYVVYKRIPNYWGDNLAVNRGTNNFERIRVEYFRDDTVQFEAFKTGAFDFVRESTARKWVTGYDFPAAKQGRVKKIEVTDGSPMNYQSIIFNLRRPLFQDRRVRQALNYAFDFESLNKTIFYQQYQRLRSYWQKSELEAKGLASAAELALLEPLREKLPPEVFTQEFAQPTNNDPNDLRANLLKARDLLAQAGWVVRNGALVKADTGAAFVFEIMEVQAGLDAILNPWIQNLERLGIKASIRLIDSSQFFNRINDFDFDVTSVPGANSLSPGNEQLEYWGSSAAKNTGSQNYSGVGDPAVDALIEKIINARDRDSLVTAAHALDRVLTWNFFRLLTYGSPTERFAYWSKLQRPEKFPMHGLGVGAGIVSTWWMDPAAATPARP